MKKVLFPILLISGIILIILTLYLVPERDIPTSLNFDFPQWHLPEGAKARIGSGGVNVMRYSPDGSLLAVGSNIGVWIYDVHTTEPLSLLGAYSSAVNSVSFTPDSSLLAAGFEDGIIRVWDLSTGEYKHTFTRRRYRTGVDNVSFTSDGRALAAATIFGELDLWDMVTGTRKIDPDALKNTRAVFERDDLPYITLGGPLSSFSLDGKTVANWSWGGSPIIRVWDIMTREQIQTLTFEGLSDSVSLRPDSVSLRPDGRLLAATCRKGPIQIWDVNTGIEKQTILTDSDLIPNLTFSADGRLFATTNKYEPGRLWDVNTGKEQEIFKRKKNRVLSVAFSPDHRTLATLNYDGVLRMWNIDTGKTEKSIIEPGQKFGNVSMTRDGETLSSLHFGSNAIHLWHTDTGKHKKTFKGPKKGSARAMLRPNGKHLVSYTVPDNIIYVWNTNTGKLKKLKVPQERFSGVSFSSDGETLAIPGYGRKYQKFLRRVFSLWDMETLSWKQNLTPAKYIFETHYKKTEAHYFDRKTFAGLEWDGYLQLIYLYQWDIPTGAYTQREITLRKRGTGAQTKKPTNPRLSPDGRTIAIVFRDESLNESRQPPDIELWDVNTGERTQILKGHTDDIRSIAFSPDSRTLASGSIDKTIRLWDVNTGQQKRTLTAQDWLGEQFYNVGHVQEVIFSPDGRTLASGMWRGSIHLWDTVTGKKKKTFTGHTRWVVHLLFSEDGQTLISTSGDQTVLVWDITKL